MIVPTVTPLRPTGDGRLELDEARLQEPRAPPPVADS